MDLKRRQRSHAYTLIEMAIVLLIVGLLISTIRPAYLEIVNTTKSKDVVTELAELSDTINDYFKEHGEYPDSLEEVFSPVPLDPWGRPYEYLRIEGAGSKGKGKLRKDKNLVPINSDFDLYSRGPDGESVSPLTANPSKDDIVRGRNGAFFGVATDY